MASSDNLLIINNFCRADKRSVIRRNGFIGSLEALRVAVASSNNLLIINNFCRADQRSVIRRYWLYWEP
jgi:hypothetical protein